MRAGVVVGHDPTYNLTSLDLGKAISVRVTAKLDDHIPSVSTSVATQPVGGLPMLGWDNQATRPCRTTPPPRC